MFQFEFLLSTDAVEKLGYWRGEALFESFLTSFYASPAVTASPGLQLG
jgi:hypothetical protein